MEANELMILKGKAIRWYKQRWVQDEIAKLADGREASFRYPNGGFSKRPDSIHYANDAFEMAKQGATSFHVSEERWASALNLRTGMTRKDLDSERYAWDFIIDIDSKDWTLSKTAAWIIVKVLKAEGVKSISCKFSGSKGFHIGVPFEAFPQELNGKFTRDMFPEWPKALAMYILHVIEKDYLKITADEVIVGDRVRYKIENLKELMKAEDKQLYNQVCADCGSVIHKVPKPIVDFNCKCGNTERVFDLEEEYRSCSKCGAFMERFEHIPEVCDCGSKKMPITKFNVLSIIDVDTILISSRHMFRCVYSLHEKSGLISVPIPLDKILDFEKTDAEPAKISRSELTFLDRDNVSEGEAKGLLERAVALQEAQEQIEEERTSKIKKKFVKLEGAVPKELFPPCIKSILAGIPDGKKRAMFILLNFLHSVGWTDDMIEVEMKEWNERNPEPLRQTILLGQIRHFKATRKEAILPPNCNNDAYYRSFGVCKPDAICRKIKNPVNYATRKYFFASRKQRKMKNAQG